MEYTGKLYGRLGGDTYFDTGKTSDDWDKLNEAVKVQTQTIKALIAGDRVVNLDEAIAYYERLVNQ